MKSNKNDYDTTSHTTRTSSNSFDSMIGRLPFLPSPLLPKDISPLSTTSSPPIHASVPIAPEQTSARPIYNSTPHTYTPPIDHPPQPTTNYNQPPPPPANHSDMSHELFDDIFPDDEITKSNDSGNMERVKMKKRPPISLPTLKYCGYCSILSGLCNCKKGL